MRHRLTENAAKSVVHAIVISRLDYCNSLLIDIPKRLIYRLKRILNRCARVVQTSSNESVMHKVKAGMPL